MLDKTSCSFILVAILILMLIHYTSNTPKEKFTITQYNGSGTLDDVFIPSEFDVTYKTFYVAVGKVKQTPERFLSMNSNEELVASTNTASKITFVPDPRRQNSWNINIYDDATGKTLFLTSTLSKEGYENYHTNQIGFNTPHGALPDQIQQGATPPESADINWDEEWTPQTLAAIDTNINSMRSNARQYSSENPVVLTFSDDRRPASFKLNISGNVIEPMYYDSVDHALYPLGVLPDNKVTVFRNASYVSSGFRLFVGSNITGIIEGAQFWNTHLVTKITPSPKPGTFITIGDKSEAFIMRVQHAIKTRTTNDIFQLVGDLEVKEDDQIARGIIPYIFKVTCPPQIIQDFTNSPNVDNLVKDIDLDDIKPEKPSNGIFKVCDFTDVGAPSIMSQCGSFERFTLDPTSICTQSHTYILEVYDYSGRYIIAPNGTTIDALTGSPGPDMPYLITPELITGRTWHRAWGSVLI